MKLYVVKSSQTRNEIARFTTKQKCKALINDHPQLNLVITKIKVSFFEWFIRKIILF